MKNDIILIMLLGLIIFASTGLTQEKPEETKLVVYSLVPNSPAEKAGIMPMDIFIKYDGKPVNTQKLLDDYKAQAIGDSVLIMVLRDNKEMQFKLPTGHMGVYLKEFFPDIKNLEDAVVIEGIPKLDWETGKLATFFAALEAVANYLDVPKDYVELKGISGSAFRFHFREGWCPSSPDPTRGYNTGEDALSALGFEFRGMSLSKDGKNKEEMKNAIIQSISKKMPVIAIYLIKMAEWGIITGYQKNGEEFLCRTYFDNRESYEIAQRFPFAIYIISERKKPLDNLASYRKSFVIALNNLKNMMYDDYYSGIAAFKEWIERLEKDDFATMDSATYYRCAIANAWIYERLTEDRMNAAKYLERIKEHFPELMDNLQGLAKIYEDESNMLKEMNDVVVYDYNAESRANWTPEMRQKEIEVLSKVKAKEEKAAIAWDEIAKLTAKKQK